MKPNPEDVKVRFLFVFAAAAVTAVVGGVVVASCC